MRFIRATVLGVVLGALILCFIALLTEAVEARNRLADRHITVEEYETFVTDGILPSQQDD